MYSKLFIVALSGGFIALATFVDAWQLQTFTLIAIAPAFVATSKLPAKLHYLAGLVFFGAWLLPTTYWYYSFMPWWLALLASFGFVTLIANLFHLFTLQKSKAFPTWVILGLITVLWPLFTCLRLHLPTLEDWWIPHLGYAVWQNSGLLQLAHIGGEALLEFAVLLTNAVIALAILRQRYRLASILAVVTICGAISANLLVRDSPPPTPNIVAVQQMTLGGVDVPATTGDISRLVSTAQRALQTPKDKPTIAVWPENSIPEALEQNVATAAQSLGVAIVYHTVETQDSKRFKKSVLVNAAGHKQLLNYKKHIAPDENGSPRSSQNITTLGGYNITTYTCYDMHYPDSVVRIGHADIVLVPINDANYGTLQKTLHTADLAIRAVQTRASVFSASTNGPTVHIAPTGVVVKRLPYGIDGVLWRR